MSFLDNNNSESISARITQKGRNSIAKGNFNIEYFQIGDSEFDYNFNTLTGQTNHQMVMSPFDRSTNVKYPFKLDDSEGSTTFGNPIQNSTIETLRNVMGPAGFVSNFLEYDNTECTGTTIHTIKQEIDIISLTGGTSISFTGETFYNCEYVTLAFKPFCGTDPDLPVISGNSTSLIYKVIDFTTGVTYNTITFDRKTPNLTGLTGSVEMICNGGEIEYPLSSEVSPVCSPNLIDNSEQLNPWKLNVVWTEKPIGADVSATDEELTGYTSNKFVSTKELLGYTSTGQTFNNYTGGTITYPTSYLNSFDEQILVNPSEQRTIAIIHYSELGDIVNDPERFFKYDDYISTNDDEDDTLYTDQDDVDVTDKDYFEIYIPFIHYHRSTGTTYGSIFTMDDTDYYIRSTKNDRHDLLFRYLIDEVGNKVGKIFPNNKIVVFDDQELVAILDYRSNRRFTLGAPKVATVHSNDTASNSLISGTTGQTFWVTYMFSNDNGESPLNYLPCNYYSKVEVNVNDDECSIPYPSNITVKFTGDVFQHMKTTLSEYTNGFLAKNFKILIQDNVEPISNEWRVIDYTTEAGGNGTSYLNPSGLTDTTFTVTKSEFDSAPYFDLETYMGNDYLWNTTGSTTQPQFGDEQPFPGSIRLVRSSDIEEFRFLINLPSGQFDTTQNPTYVSGERMISEVTLLDSNKDVLVIGKTATPIKRKGTQVFAVKLDF
jgi:hypothetical protein